MAIDYFLKLDGIDGESTDARHRNEIVVLSWRWGIDAPASPGSGGGGGAGRARPQAFVFTHGYDKAGPSISKAAASGRHIATGVLSARRSAAKTAGDFFTITMHDVLVTAVEDGGDATQMAQQVSLQMARIDVSYRPQAANGSLGGPVAMGWDITRNVVT